MWRILPRRFANPAYRAYDGLGAAKNGRRWNAKGVAVAYAAATLSLAALEYLAWLGDVEDAPDHLVSVLAEFDEGAVEVADVASIPEWDAFPPDASVRFGTQWAKELRSVVLQIPSVMIPSEANYVLNPVHPEFERAVHVRDARPFAFDRRLLRS